MKLCKDCKYFVNPGVEQTPICSRSEAQIKDDPVWGNHSKRTCLEMRNNAHYCGALARYWIAAADFTPVEYTNENN